MDYNTHRWSDFILMPRVKATGMREHWIKGAYTIASTGLGINNSVD